MKCEYILGITVMKDSSDQELEASYIALNKKYKEHPDIFFLGFKCYLHNFNSILFEEDSLSKFIGKQNVGLYWEVHANQYDTAPTIEGLAQVTAELINKGIGFRKINLSGCFSAGMDKGGGGGDPVDFPDSLQLRFCGFLAKYVVDPKQIDNCMVCGYRSIIILYDSESEYFTKQEHALTKFKAVGSGVKNTFSSGGSLLQTHPKEVEYKDFENYLGKRKERIMELAKKKNITFSKDGLGFYSSDKLENSNIQADPMHKVYMAVCKYIRLKRVVKFESKNNGWVPASLSEWSDNQTIKQMVRRVDDLNLKECEEVLKVPICSVIIVP